MGGKIRAAYKMSLLGKEMAQMNETLTATEVILKTDQAYALVVKAKEMKTVADTYHAVLAELQKNVESAYKHGLKPQNDVLKVQVKLNESELGIRKAENALRLATMNLCHLIGKPLTTEILISGDFPEIEQEMELQVLDITRRPEYGILDKQVAIARQQVKLNRSELLPKVGIKGSYDYVHGLELNEKNFLDNLQQQNLNEQMLLELIQAANNLDEAKLESELADRSLRQAEENRRVSKSQYEVGLETLSDHLEAQALWQQAYETQVDARFQLYLNYVAYLKAAGTLHDKL